MSESNSTTTNRALIENIVDSMRANSDSDIDELISGVLDRLGDNWVGWSDANLWTRALDHASYLFRLRHVDLSPLCEGHDDHRGPYSSFCDGTCHAHQWKAA